MTASKRCPWAGTDPLYIAYHDEEWGVPVHDDRRLFELLVLEGAQAGLSWRTILEKRARYREVFAGFDPAEVARFDERKKRQLLRDPGIVRNRLKIDAAVDDAKAFLAVAREHGSFDAWCWGVLGGRPVVNHPRRPSDVPAKTAASELLSRELKQRGFRFVGPTICYAFMQACGFVDDHLVGCPAKRRSRAAAPG